MAKKTESVVIVPKMPGDVRRNIAKLERRATPAKKSFSETEITITMTGEEWFTILTKMVRPTEALSAKGKVVFKSAQAKLVAAIEPVSEATKGIQ